MFDTPDFAVGQIVGDGQVRQVVYGQDSGLYVEFRTEEVYQEFRSEAEGRPIYETVPFIRMYTPGDKTKVVDRAVKMQPQGDVPSDPQRFPQQWAAFVAGARAAASGTPLSEWTKISASQVREFNALNIHTVEQLAAVSDGALDGLGHGGRAMRDGAKLWLEASEGNAVLTRMQANEEAMRAEMDALREQIAALTADKRGPGRPPKEPA